MAWYRCGGGGLPAGLQSDMDTVLNKKFSTSTTYPPTDWPDTINLMGPLPEKTASGSIANITDGADGVPLKNWLVTLPASLDGYTEVNGKKNTGTGTPETQYTASLGRTIYGGTADIVNGEGSETHKGYTLDNLTWSGGIIGGQMWCWYVDLSAEGLKLPANSAIFDGISDNYTPIRYNGISSNANTIALRSNGYLYVNNGSDTVQPTGKVTIALDAPETFTFTPITPTPETALGVNNFWADEGDSDVTYRADISLALQALGGGGRGLMMMRPTEPEETEETEETEGLEDELNR